MKQPFLYAIMIMVCAAAFITIIQMWFPFMSWDNYFKAIITLAILTVVAAFVLVIKSDLGQHKKMKDENYLD
ncbi:MAG: hypothetical protein GC137_01910 [Alphaproteobacteria bacterium]|nr:hypothetical protein [Alphaproteobacteria bacterium]